MTSVFSGFSGSQPNPNTMVLHHPSGESALFNYGTLIAGMVNDKPTFVTNAWDYSRTTMKRVSVFFGQPAADTRRMIASGELTLLT